MNHQAAIIRAARRKGMDPTDLNAGQYVALSLGVRTAREKLAAAASMLKARSTSAASRVMPSLVVLPQVREANLIKCRENACGSYALLKDGTEVCHRCGCAGRNLYSKAEQKGSFCPHEPPLWDNRSPS